MKIGILDGSLARPWPELYKAAADSGFDGVELGVANKYAESDLWSKEGRGRLNEYARAAGIPTASVCIHSFWGKSFAKQEEGAMDAAIQLAREAAEATAGVGATNILVPLTGGGNSDPADCRKRWIEGIKKAAPTAEKCGVVFCLENVNQPFADKAEDIIEIVDSVKSPNVKVYYDAGNAVKGGNDPLAQMDALGARIAHAHVKEIEGELLGEGKVPWPEIIKKYREIKYDGWLIFETASTDDPANAAIKNLAHMRAIVG